MTHTDDALTPFASFLGLTRVLIEFAPIPIILVKAKLFYLIIARQIEGFTYVRQEMGVIKYHDALGRHASYILTYNER